MQLRCNNVYCLVDENFVFSEVTYSIMTIISKQQCSCPDWLVSLGILLKWHFLTPGVSVAEQSSSSSGWLRLGGLGLFFPMCPLQCLMHKEPSRTMPSGWSPDRHHLLLAVPPPQSFIHLRIDCITQGIITIGQIFFCTRPLLFQLFIHETWSKVPTYF